MLAVARTSLAFKLDQRAVSQDTRSSLKVTVAVPVEANESREGWLLQYEISRPVACDPEPRGVRIGDVVLPPDGLRCSDVRPRLAVQRIRPALALVRDLLLLWSFTQDAQLPKTSVDVSLATWAKLVRLSRQAPPLV